MTTPSLRLVAICSAAIVVASIITATAWSDYPSWMWYLLAPVGIFLAGATAVLSTGELARRRFFSSGR
ncbi:MAG: hypothetical protein ACT452_13320 [Microthrixaceae bacterium]